MSAFSWMEHPASFFGWALRIIAPPNDWPFTWKLRFDSLFRKTASRWAINACKAIEAARSP